MKPQLLKRNPKDYLESISYQRTVASNFLPLWHYHPELELVYIVRGSGNFFAGDHIERFEPGSLVLLGSNLPHKWLNDAAYFQEGSELVAESITIHFSVDFLQTPLKKIPEFSGLGQLIDRAKVGIHFVGSSPWVLSKMLTEMQNMDEFTRLLRFLEVLRHLAEAREIEYLSSSGYLKMFRDTDDRLAWVHEHVMNNFQRTIRLDEVARIACMNKSAFCRYFKKATKKNFSSYLNEIRIGYSCKLLQENPSASIAEIAYECGFNNVSNFNRQFKLNMGIPPSAYLKKHQSF